MFDHRIEILEYVEERDAYNDRTQRLRSVAVCYAQYTEAGGRETYNDRTQRLRSVALCYAQYTEAGGRENLYAGRIAHENEAVYTIRWIPGLHPDMIVRDEGILRHITSIHAEGRRWRLHIKCKKSDADTES